MHAPARQGVEVERQRGHEGLPLARRHLGDLPFVQDDPADELHIVGHHVPRQLVAGDDDLRAQQPPARVAHGGEHLREDGIEDALHLLRVRRLGLGQLIGELESLLGVRAIVLRLLEALHLGREHARPLPDDAAELLGLGPHLGVGQPLQALLVRMNRIHDGPDALHLAPEARTHNLGDQRLQHRSSNDTTRWPRCTRAPPRARDTGSTGPAPPALGSCSPRRRWPAPRPPG